MSSADDLATIDLLRARGFPEAPGRSGVGRAGPGFHLAELRTYEPGEDDDGTAYADAEEQYEAERDALAVLLDGRWGPAQVFSLAGAFARHVAEAPDVPEPWASVSETVPDVHLWRAGQQWIAVGVARWGERGALQLLALVTEVDPP
ncbi:hypothetical protein GCM10018785_11070 [Streptomyces longispororuber]|uniref:Uncharacterized protein n=1 Tax=Streptomyces longispororuber TaxID=68230 RepID=A0A918Z9X8_9ACTN|nr:hypothetical protein [Streptomyces longispororuber]GHE43171.1 hypothetical protein GCM10018785_11070 [Streptomyces longispororuber]